jgi:APA family basic amino acid/polyamine antiporter
MAMTTCGRRTAEKLTGRVGFLGLLALSLGLGAGAGTFALVGAAGAEAGPALPVSVLLAAVPALLALVPVTVLARGHPTTAATYRYLQLANPVLAFVGVLVLAAALLLGGLPLFATMVGAHVADLVPALPPVAVGAAALVLLSLANLAGARLAVAVQVVLLLVLVAALGLLVGTGAPALEARHFDRLFEVGVSGVFLGAGVLSLLLAGGLFVIEVGDEATRPRRLYGWALPLAMVLAVIVELAVSVIAVGVVRWTALQGGTLVSVSQLWLSEPVQASVVVGGAAVGGLTGINVVCLIGSRMLMVVAEDGLLPRGLRRVNRRGVPHVALTVALAVSLAVLLAGPDGAFLGALTRAGPAAAVALVALVGARVPRTHPGIVAASGSRLHPRTITVLARLAALLHAAVLGQLLLDAPAAVGALALVAVVALAYRLAADEAWSARMAPAGGAEPSEFGLAIDEARAPRR